MIKMHTLSLQAESMVASALNNGKNFERATTAFFRSANEAPGNGLVAYYSAVNNAAKENKTSNVCKFLLGKPSIAEIVSNKIEAVLSKNKELNEEVKSFMNNLSSLYKSSLEDRIALASSGCVRADGVHKHSILEGFKATLDSVCRKGLSGNISE